MRKIMKVNLKIKVIHYTISASEIDDVWPLIVSSLECSFAVVVAVVVAVVAVVVPVVVVVADVVVALIVRDFVANSMKNCNVLTFL